MKTPMKTLAPLAVLSLVSLAAVDVHADEPPKFGALARGAVTMPPQKVGPASTQIPMQSAPP